MYLCGVNHINIRMDIAVSSSGVSSVDASWSLIMQQAKSTRRILTERLMASDMEGAEQMLLKASIRRGWEQVQAMKQSGTHKGTLQDLIVEIGKG